MACYVVNTSAEDDSGKKKCSPVLEDYYECLHHKKEVRLCLPSLDEPTRVSQRQAANKTAPRSTRERWPCRRPMRAPRRPLPETTPPAPGKYGTWGCWARRRIRRRCWGRARRAGERSGGWRMQHCILALSSAPASLLASSASGQGAREGDHTIWENIRPFVLFLHTCLPACRDTATMRASRNIRCPSCTAASRLGSGCRVDGAETRTAVAQLIHCSVRWVAITTVGVLAQSSLESPLASSVQVTFFFSWSHLFRVLAHNKHRQQLPSRAACLLPISCLAAPTAWGKAFSWHGDLSVAGLAASPSRQESPPGLERRAQLSIISRQHHAWPPGHRNFHHSSARVPQAPRVSSPGCVLDPRPCRWA